MRILLTAIAYFVALTVVAVAAFFTVMFLAGPHTGLLPNWLGTFVLALGWVAVLVVPILLARRIWKRLGRSAAS